MKKRVFMILACVAVSALVFGGCGKKAEETTPEPGQETPVEEGAEEVVYTSEDGRPPFADDLKELYTGAVAAYEGLSTGGLAFDADATMEKDGNTYYKVTETGMGTYEEYKTYLNQYFTMDFINSEILTDKNLMFTQDEEGTLYTLGGGRGINVFYAGHVFHAVEEKGDEMKLTATAYYANGEEAVEAEPFFVAPENADEYTTQDFTIHMMKEDGQWKFDDFMLFR